MPERSRHKRGLSIRQRVLIWTATPLLLLGVVNAWASYRAALETAHTAYDRLLVTAVHALGDMIWLENGKLQVSMPHSALELYGNEVPESARTTPERSPLLYRVSFLNGTILAGDRTIPVITTPAPANSHARLMLYDETLHQQTMRMAALWQPVESAEGLQYVVVQVGEYADYRYAIGRSILRQTLGHQALLLTVVLLVLWLALSVGLRPVRQLADMLDRRQAGDAKPLHMAQPPHEIIPLLHAFNGLLQRMQRTQALQQRFVADASHQLRTPLTVLQLHAEAGLHGDISMPDALQAITHTTQRTSRVVHQLLMWNRAQQTPAHLATECNLREVMQEVALEQSPLLARKELDFTLEAPPTCWQGHAWMVQEVLMNLLSNAIRHTPQGGALGLRLEQHAGQIALTVWDSGPGLSLQMQQDLFTPFVSEGCHGVGLGLAISRDLAQACGGRLEVNNRAPAHQPQGLQATLWLTST
jgi:two-component system, OmpR family, sensor histidine kinase TctE